MGIVHGYRTWSGWLIPPPKNKHKLSSVQNSSLIALNPGWFSSGSLYWSIYCNSQYMKASIIHINPLYSSIFINQQRFSFHYSGGFSICDPTVPALYPKELSTKRMVDTITAWWFQFLWKYMWIYLVSSTIYNHLWPSVITIYNNHPHMYRL